MAIAPAVAGSASAAQPVTSQMQEPMGGAPSGDLMAFTGEIKQISQSVDALAQKNPDIADVLQQVKAVLRQAIVKKASTASMQTPSAEALPMGGM